jgi:hypothetical protein
LLRRRLSTAEAPGGKGSHGDQKIRRKSTLLRETSLIGKNATATAMTAREKKERTQEMKDKHGIPRPTESSNGHGGNGRWKAINFGGPGRDRRPRPDAAGSHCAEERPMIASGNDFADLVDALRNHTAAITNLVATLAPEVPDYVGTDYLARKLGVSPQWIGQMAERGDIPRQCIIKKTGKGRIWKFNRIEVDQWLSERGHG